MKGSAYLRLSRFYRLLHAPTTFEARKLLFILFYPFNPAGVSANTILLKTLQIITALVTTNVVLAYRTLSMIKR